ARRALPRPTPKALALWVGPWRSLRGSAHAGAGWQMGAGSGAIRVKARSVRSLDVVWVLRGVN
ncbi:unnamed protein product, partial [Laminaria digitata]